jgi:hypothetical protein
MTRSDPKCFPSSDDKYYSINDFRGYPSEKLQPKDCGCFHTEYIIDNRGWTADETVYKYYKCDQHISLKE